jgi:LmbE family N-acetylglucosaminyl deacetylase
MSKSKPVLVVAAHPDDEVLGCGATLAGLASQGHEVHILLMADGETARAREPGGSDAQSLVRARETAAQQACRILGCTSVEMLSLPDNRLDGVELLTVVQLIEARIQRLRPATVFTHYSADVNIDHRVVHDAVIAATRPQPGHPVKELLFFEVASATEWRPPSSFAPFNPNWFVDVSATLPKKLEALRAYASELREFPHPRSLAAVEALARWRGATAGVQAAEAFVLGRRISS